MKNVTTVKQPLNQEGLSGKQRSYHEIVEFLDKHWDAQADVAQTCMKKLDQAFGNVTQKMNTILVDGTNGKSLTAHLSVKLLKEEGLTVGALYNPHFLTYNERVSVNNEYISNKSFTEIGNEILNTLESAQITPHSAAILAIMGFLHFKASNVDVAVLEVAQQEHANVTAVCNPVIVAVTRITPDGAEHAEPAAIQRMLVSVKKDTHVVSADQSKLNLQTMQDIVTEKQGVWGMPIRKLAPLTYPFEQLHGRCAALAERIAHTYINTFVNKNAVVISGTLLSKQVGKRGRPTIEAKRQSELNPKRTLEQFWKDTYNTLPGRFQLLDKEKPSILLDNASNLDAFKNLLLGIRLLHYQRPLKGLTVIIGCNNPTVDVEEFTRLLRYFFKKTSGNVIVCPVDLPVHETGASWDVEKVTNDIKSMKIKARSSKNFKEAFEVAQKSVDERHGLVVITGSDSIIAEYWRYKGLKKL